jgi:hypothetical protein
LFDAAAQVLKNLLLPLLHLQKDWLGELQIALRRMDLASLQENVPEFSNALLSN